jgi:hypothetical protein
MRQGARRRMVIVPSGTDEREMTQLVVSRFRENARKRWLVITRDTAPREREYQLLGGWSYKLAEEKSPPAPQTAKANTKRGDLRWNIELDTDWTER